MKTSELAETIVNELKEKLGVELEFEKEEIE